MTMLKDNHITSEGSIQKAVLKAKQFTGFSAKIEVYIKICNKFAYKNA